MDNKDVYLTDTYKVFVNDVLYAETNKNVLSIYDLLPNKTYEIKVMQNSEVKTLTVQTDFEYVTLNVKKFGAKGDGKTLDTRAIQGCILSCPDNGRVFFPDGKYYTGPLFLRSNITIELSEGAELIGDTDRTHYPVLPGMTYTTDEKDEYNLGSWEGNPLDCFASIITGINVSNVKIIGKGIINGNANNSDWWIDVRTRRIAWRPRGVFLNHCNNYYLYLFLLPFLLNEIQKILIRICLLNNHYYLSFFQNFLLVFLS
jgi:polygalacturonase